LSFFLPLLISLVVSYSPQAQAYLVHGESADLVPADHYQAGAATDLLLTSKSGLDLFGFFDMPATDDSSIRFIGSTGETDFTLGGYWKWIPVPDYDSQPAMGVKVGAVLAREGTESIVSLRVHPMISKKYLTEAGTFTPYAALPIGVTSYKEKNIIPMNLVVGSDYHIPGFKKFWFTGEIGINVQDSEAYIYDAITFDIDENGIEFR
jgi:hypothetical protein